MFTKTGKNTENGTSRGWRPKLWSGWSLLTGAGQLRDSVGGSSSPLLSGGGVLPRCVRGKTPTQSPINIPTRGPGESRKK